MGLLIVFFTISIIFSFLCSIWEAVLLSVTPAYVEVEKNSGSKTGRLLNEFKENIDRPLAAILTLNTVAHTVGAIGVGAQASAYFGAGIMNSVIIPVGMTLAILIFSEIIPKTLGANYWKSLAPFTMKSIDIIIKLLYPLVWVSQLITKRLKKDKSKSVLSRSDFMAITKIAGKQGLFNSGESRIMENLMIFDKVEAKDVMTPRTVVLASREDMTIQEFYDAHENLRFSRIPIYSGSKDNIIGFVHKDDLLDAIINKNGSSLLSSIKREIAVVNDSMSMTKVFDTMVKSRAHIAIVVGEFGGLSGVVTMEDIIETLLGLEIVDEFDGTEDMQDLARKNWVKRAEKLGITTTEDAES